MKKQLSNYVLILVLLAGLSLLLYPTLSDYWNSFHHSRAIVTYSEGLASIDEETYNRIWDEAAEYNSSLQKRTNAYLLTDEQKEKYKDLLNVNGDGMIGYIEIPSIDCSLPIYHGTSDRTLQTAIGHLEWTSLPIGGVSTHSVLSGHRGLPSAKLFTNLDKLGEGDIFYIHVLDETLAYAVDQILIVEPDDVKDLKIIEGEDYCTLVTCTPYGINTHRLLVRGHRIKIEESNTVYVTADAIQIEPLLIAPILAVIMLMILLIILVVKDKGRKTKQKR